MRTLFQRFFLSATVVALLTFGAAGALHVSDRAQAVIYGQPTAVLAMRQTDGRLTLTDREASLPLPDLSFAAQWAPLLYLTPLGSVIGLISAVRS